MTTAATMASQPVPQPPAAEVATTVTYRHGGGTLGDIAAGEGSVWLTVTGPEAGMRGALVRLAPAIVQPVATCPLADYPLSVEVGNGRAWLLSMRAIPFVRLVSVDVASGEVVLDVPLPGTVRGNPPSAHLALGDGAVWVALKEETTQDHRLLRLDPPSGDVVATIPLPASPLAIAADDSVWIGTEDGRLLRVDPRSNQLAADVRLGEEILDVSADAASVWISAWTAGDSVELLRDGGLTRTGIPVSMVEARGGQVWVANYGNPPPASTGFVAQLDAGTNKLGRSTSVQTVSNDGVAALAVDEGTVWILSPATGAVTGVGLRSS